MDEDGQGVAIGAVAGGDDIDGPGLIGGIAGSEIGNAAAGVTVPGAGAESAGGGAAGDDVSDGHVGLAVGVEDSIGVGGNGDGSASAVNGLRGGDLADLREVHGDAKDLRCQRDGSRLAHDGAGTTLTVHDGTTFAASRDGDTERDREKK